MPLLDRLFEAEPYSLSAPEKSALLVPALRELTAHHSARSGRYRDILRMVPAGEGTGLAAIPFLPARLFKSVSLRSIPESDIVRILVSSGTTSSQLTSVVLDRETATLQTRALVSIMNAFIGSKRMPLVLVDSRQAAAGASGSMSARGAGLVGMTTFGRDTFYALDERMELDADGLLQFLARHEGERILLFGFTFMVWQYFYQRLLRHPARPRFAGATLIHSGGWKKLQDMAVDNTAFKQALLRDLGIDRVHNFYGMVEQVGSVYMECEDGRLHAPNFADVIIRDHRDWTPAPIGVPGLLQTLSVLPRSYPGHSILTEDLGRIEGVDDCRCGRRGTHFSVLGRVARAELRGCSDTHTAVAA